jgi:D-alanyl-D-alanine carboxypeptidase/D-alanyl-D-alanine-endopeptidase (penicillin-binding protein 4)
VLRTNAYESGLKEPHSFTSLDSLASAVREAGITKVTGSIMGDDSRYDSERVVAGWNPVYTEEGDVGPLSALDVNDGFTPPPAASAGNGRPTATGPAAGAASEFATLLRADGVTVEGSVAIGTTPARSVLVASATSPPLAEIVEGMLTLSDDTTAELLVKEMGYRATGTGTTSAGLAVERRALVALGLPVSQLSAQDGSGLDRSDRVTCSLMDDALRVAGPSGVLAAGLPVAAQSGTLTDRFVKTVASGRVRAKTGTLDYVSALSGFASPEPVKGTATPLSAPLVFSLIVDGLAPAASIPLIDSSVLELFDYPRVAPLSAIGPQR